MRVNVMQRLADGRKNKIWNNYCPGYMEQKLKKVFLLFWICEVSRNKKKQWHVEAMDIMAECTPKANMPHDHEQNTETTVDVKEF